VKYIVTKASPAHDTSRVEHSTLIKASDWAYFIDPDQLPTAKPDPHGTLEVKEVAPIPRKRKNHEVLRTESGCKRANTGLLVRTSTESVYLVSSGVVGCVRGKISPIAAQAPSSGSTLI
jgi:hypothetical protein